MSPLQASICTGRPTVSSSHLCHCLPLVHTTRRLRAVLVAVLAVLAVLLVVLVGANTDADADLEPVPIVVTSTISGLLLLLLEGIAHLLLDSNDSAIDCECVLCGLIRKHFTDSF